MWTMILGMEFILYTIVLWSAFISSRLSELTKDKIPIVTLTLSSVLFIILALQMAYPPLLQMFERNTALIVDGEVWRIVTALFFQDGGLIGGIINIFYLLLIGSVTEMRLGKYRFLIVFFMGGILSECIALLWQPIGAGNSVANFALAGSLLFLVLTKASAKLKILSMIGFLGAILLVFLKDIHGGAVIIGMLCAISLTNAKIKQ